MRAVAAAGLSSFWPSCRSGPRPDAVDGPVSDSRARRSNRCPPHLSRSRPLRRAGYRRRGRGRSRGHGSAEHAGGGDGGGGGGGDVDVEAAAAAVEAAAPRSSGARARARARARAAASGPRRPSLQPPSRAASASCDSRAGAGLRHRWRRARSPWERRRPGCPGPSGAQARALDRARVGVRARGAGRRRQKLLSLGGVCCCGLVTGPGGSKCRSGRPQSPALVLTQ